jgi:hypothetical protein
MRLTVSRHVEGLAATVAIHRLGGAIETLPLIPKPDDHHEMVSSSAPAEPHEFDAELELRDNKDRKESMAFQMKEPEGHHH